MLNEVVKVLRPLPKVGKCYHFWDDGKTGLSRHYICKCESIVPFDDAKNIMLNAQGDDGPIDISLHDIWQDECDNCDWLYAKETDYFVECSCPTYDEHNLWFARTKDGGWFSMNIQSFWQSGRLDVDGNIFEDVISYLKEYRNDDNLYVIKQYTDATYEKK